jgi:hypothetical protein
MNHAIRTSLVVLLAVPAACGGRSDQTAGGRRSDTVDTAAPAPTGMLGRDGMYGMMGDSTMMRQMESHIQAMQGASGDTMKAMLPMHRQMAANMIAQMNGQMRQMNMQPDPAWNATVDSLRQDLVRMPEMSAPELQSFMPAHTERMQRLMRMHGAMMSAGH